LAHPKNVLREAKLNGNIVIGEILRNMELGRFEMAYTVLLPCVFTVYLNPADHAVLSGVFQFVVEDARKALRARVAELNSGPAVFGLARRAKAAKEHKIACRDWDIEFLPDSEVPPGDVEIHSELNEVAQPGYRGTKTTLMGREPSVTAQRSTSQRADPPRAPDPVYAEIQYQDDSGPQVYLVMQNRIRVGRGGDDQPMDLALYTTDEVSREHLVIRREPGTGKFFIVDASTNGTWVNGKRLRRGAEDVLPNSAQIGVGEVLVLSFEVRK
jgi:hypothetical protein